MNLPDYLETLTAPERIAFAKRAGTSDNYLAQIKGRHRQPSVKLAQAFVKASGGALTFAEIFDAEPA